MGVLLSFCGIVKVCQQIPLGHLKDLTQAGQLIILDKPAVSLNFADKRLVNVHAQQLQLGGQFLLGEPALLPKLSEDLFMFYTNTIYFLDYIMPGDL